MMKQTTDNADVFISDIVFSPDSVSESAEKIRDRIFEESKKSHWYHSTSQTRRAIAAMTRGIVAKIDSIRKALKESEEKTDRHGETIRTQEAISRNKELKTTIENILWAWQETGERSRAKRKKYRKKLSEMTAINADDAVKAWLTPRDVSIRTNSVITVSPHEDFLVMASPQEDLKMLRLAQQAAAVSDALKDARYIHELRAVAVLVARELLPNEVHTPDSAIVAAKKVVKEYQPASELGRKAKNILEKII